MRMRRGHPPRDQAGDPGRCSLRTLADKRGDRVAIVGLAIGGIFGIAGSVAPQVHLRQLFWMLDGVGLIVAAALLVQQ